MQSDLIYFRERLKVIFMYFDNTKAKGDEAANREAMNKVSWIAYVFNSNYDASFTLRRSKSWSKR